MATDVSSRYFKDISLSFKRHPITNDMIILTNEDAIKKSVQNLVRTNIGERFFNPLLGSKVAFYLFELSNSDIEYILTDEIRTLLSNFETRIKVTEVQVEVLQDNYELNVKISYDIIGSPVAVQNLEFIVQPTRQ
jgi:phage baseplate assembly protein W